MKPILLAFVLCFFLIRCQSTPTSLDKEAKTAASTSKTLSSDKIVTTDIVAPADYHPALATQLTFDGENHFATYSPKGDSILYSSFNRTQHRNAQIYLLDLGTRKDFRVTHHDGQALHPQFYGKKDVVIYASTTDEIKEDLDLSLKLKRSYAEPPLLKRILKDEYPTEIYVSRLDGSDIVRLTFHRGYDAEPVFVHHLNKIIFTSATSDDFELYAMDLLGKSKQRWVTSPGIDFNPAISANEKELTWVRAPEDRKNSEIWFSTAGAANAKVLVKNGFVNVNPHFHPNNESVIFSSNMHGNFELYTVEMKTGCIKRLTYQESEDIEPSFDPTGTKIIFTSNRTGRFQIFEMPYQPPNSCL